LCLFLFRSIYIFLSLTRFLFSFFFYINLPFILRLFYCVCEIAQNSFHHWEREKADRWIVQYWETRDEGLQANSWLWLHILDHKLVKTRQLQCRTAFTDVFQNWKHRELFKIWTLYSRHFLSSLYFWICPEIVCYSIAISLSLFLFFLRATYRFYNLQQVCAISFLRIVTMWFLKNSTL